MTILDLRGFRSRFQASSRVVNFRLYRGISFAGEEFVELHPIRVPDHSMLALSARSHSDLMRGRQAVHFLDIAGGVAKRELIEAATIFTRDGCAV